VNFTTSAYPEETFSGLVSYIAPSLAEASRTRRVKAQVPNPNSQLVPGMFGRLSLVFNVKENGLVIPEAAIQFMGGATIVVKVNKAGRSEFAPVQLGRRFSKQVEVLGGLEAGDWIVVEGYQKMGPGMRVMATADSATYGVTPGPLFPIEETPSASETAAPSAPAETEVPADQGA